MVAIRRDVEYLYDVVNSFSRSILDLVILDLDLEVLETR